jgi:O-antigen ligase
MELTDSDSGRFSLQRSSLVSSFAVMGVCVYVVGLSAPLEFRWDIPLIIFSLLTCLSAAYCWRRGLTADSSFYLLIVLFLITLALSTVISKNLWRSLEQSVPLIPAILLFFVIAEYFDGTPAIRILYVTFSCVAIGLSVLLLKAAFNYSGADPFSWIGAVGSSILAVKNDITFLSILAPLSLSLLLSRTLTVVRILAALSLFLSICVVGIYQSRVAMLTIVTSITCFSAFFRPKLAFICALTSIALILTIDSLMGFKLLERFVINWDGSGRIPLWLCAWNMFLDAPLLGNGPHTFALFYQGYLATLTLPPWLFVDPRTVPWPHNLYLEVLAEQGIFGLLSLVLLLAYGFSKAWTCRLTATDDTRILSYGAFAALVGFCLAAAIELTFLRRWVVIILFTFLGIISQLSTFRKERR